MSELQPVIKILAPSQSNPELNDKDNELSQLNPKEEKEEVDEVHLIDRQNYIDMGCFQPYGFTFTAMGKDLLCQMENCRKQAYAVCEVPMHNFYFKLGQPKFNGCGRRLC